MTEGPERTTHTLSEILLDTRTTEEKVKGAAKSAPFWVIAIMGHLILVFVFGMVVLRQESGQGSRTRASSSEVKKRRRGPQDRGEARAREGNRAHGDSSGREHRGHRGPGAVLDGDRRRRESLRAGEHQVRRLRRPGRRAGQPDDDEHRRQGPRGRHRSRRGFGRRRRRPQGQPARRLAHRPAQPAGGPAPGDREGRHGRPRVAPPPPEPGRQLGLRRLLVELRREARRGVRGRGAAVFDAGVTGLALLAFLGAGYDSRVPVPISTPFGTASST